jgi:hypothetical protein
VRRAVRSVPEEWPSSAARGVDRTRLTDRLDFSVPKTNFIATMDGSGVFDTAFHSCENISIWTNENKIRTFESENP